MSGHVFTALCWLYNSAGRQKKSLIWAVLFGLCQVLLALVPFAVIYQFLHLVIGPETLSYQHCLVLVLTATVAVLLKFVCQVASQLLAHKAAFQLLFHLRRLVIANADELPLKEFNKRSSAVMQKIVTEDIGRIEAFIAHHLPDLVAALLMPLFVILFLMFLDWRLALAALIPLPLALLTQHYMFKGFGKRVQHYFSVVARMHLMMTGFIAAISVVKAFSYTAEYEGKLKQALDDHHEVVNDWTRQGANLRVLFQIIIDSGFLFVTVTGLYLLAEDAVTLPTLVLFMLLGIGLMEPLQNLLMFGGLLTEILEGIKRIRTFTDLGNVQPNNRVLPEFSDFSVEFQHVGFRCEENKTDVLSDLSFRAPAGKVTAIVGPSGAGKSTLLHLLSGLLEADSGRIFIGDIDLAEIPPSTLMAKTSFVFQDSFIFNDSVLENVRMGQRNTTREQVHRALVHAQADAFVEDLPQGIDTLLGSDGHVLSGGECQRIAIARALIKNAPILLLDEVTAFSDAENEYRIQKALNGLLENKTVIMVTHKLQQITNVDQIVVLDQGQVIAEGSHHQLLEHCNLYRSLWLKSQFSDQWQFQGTSHDEDMEIKHGTA